MVRDQGVEDVGEGGERDFILTGAVEIAVVDCFAV